MNPHPHQEPLAGRQKMGVINARRHGLSIRKIAEMLGITYTKVLDILHITQIDAEDREADAYVEETMQMLNTRKDH